MSGPIRVNPDLEKERNAATFSTELMTHVLDCGENVTHRRRAIENLAFSDADLTGPDVRQMSRDEKFTELMRRHVLVVNKLKQHNITDDSDRMTFTSAILGVESSGLSLHFVAFVPMLRLQASDEQLKRWMPLVESFRMIGCYAQTELGHGTFVRGLETTAVYDPAKKEFLLNTPTITSTKWWVGGLGKTANHAVIMAQLYTKGECHGIHAFLLPLRDNNHMPLRGVTVGDIGPKLGMNGVDNGYLQLQNVRIPLDNMLMKHAKVLEDGTYVKPANEKIIYGGMLGIRAQLPTLAAKLLSLGVTIAIRYSCVRRQSELKPGAGEPQVLDYQTQQDKLFPLLAQAYAYNCVAQKIKQMLDEVMLQVKDGNYQGLIEAHALASGLKALTTVRTSWGIEMCRLSCGGHGYSEASNLPSIFVAAAGPATAEGEATILLLQTARYIMKNYLAAQNNKRIDNFMSYLKPGANVSNRFLSGTFDLRTLLGAYEFRALKLVNRAANCIHNQIMSRQLSPEEAWNESSIELVKAATAHIEYFIMAMFVDKVENVACHPSVCAALVKLSTLHAVHGIIQNAGDFLQEGYVTGSDLETLRDKLFALYQSVRVDAVAYVDAFDFNDRHLNSALGRYDGQVYESLYQWASESKLNSTAVHPSFHKYLHPQRIIQSSKL